VRRQKGWRTQWILEGTKVALSVHWLSLLWAYPATRRWMRQEWFCFWAVCIWLWRQIQVFATHTVAKTQSSTECLELRTSDSVWGVEIWEGFAEKVMMESSPIGWVGVSEAGKGMWDERNTPEWSVMRMAGAEPVSSWGWLGSWWMGNQYARRLLILQTVGAIKRTLSWGMKWLTHLVSRGHRLVKTGKSPRMGLRPGLGDEWLMCFIKKTLSLAILSPLSHPSRLWQQHLTDPLQSNLQQKRIKKKRANLTILSVKNHLLYGLKKMFDGGAFCNSLFLCFWVCGSK
jgi:hypothetical protein